MSITMDQARNAKEKAKALFLDRRWSTTGIGIGRKGDDLAVKVNLRAPVVTPNMPHEIDGVPIVYETVGAIVKR